MCVCVGNVLQIHTISTAQKKKNKSRAGYLPFSFSFFLPPAEENAKINK